MNLASHRFFRTDVHKRLENGLVLRFERFGYETTGKNGAIYDVDVADYDGRVEFMLNSRPHEGDPHPIHLAVVEHFGINLNPPPRQERLCVHAPSTRDSEHLVVLGEVIGYAGPEDHETAKRIASDAGYKGPVDIDTSNGGRCWVSSESPNTLDVIPAEDVRDLYHLYPRQTSPQGVFLEVDPDAGTVKLDWDRDIGGGVPCAVHHGVVRRWALPGVPSQVAAEQLLEAALPLAQKIVEDLEIGYDDQCNRVGRLREDWGAGCGNTTSLELEDLCGRLVDDDLLYVLEAYDWIGEASPSDFDLGAYATDKQIDEAAAEAVSDAWGDGVYLPDQDEVADEIRRIVEAARRDADEVALEDKWDADRELS